LVILDPLRTFPALARQSTEQSRVQLFRAVEEGTE
jgi:hypothetical protein